MASEAVERVEGGGSGDPAADRSRDWRLQTEHVEATRYLCAGVYLDEKYARRVLEEALYPPHRAVAPSYGIALEPVLKHALAARGRVLVRDGVVVAVLLVLLVLSLTAAIGLVSLLVALRLLVRTVRRLLARDLVGAAISGFGLLVAWSVAGAVGILASLGRLIVGVVTLGALLLGGGGSWQSVAVLGLPVIAFCTIWAVYLVHRLVLLRTVADQLGPGRFDPAAAPAASPAFAGRLRYVAESARNNLTVYSMRGDVRPFVGSGVVVHEWSLATPLVPAQQATLPHVPPPPPRNAGGPGLTPRTVYEACRRQLLRIALSEGEADVPLQDFTVEDHLFVAGVLPPDSPLLDPSGRPLQRVDQAYIDYVSEQPRGPQRHYLTVRMSAWGGEVVVNGHFYVSIRGGLLYAEFIATALPGVNPEYHAVDTFERLDGKAVRSAVRGAAKDVFTKAPLAPLRLAREVSARVGALRAAHGQSREVARQIGFDYGAHTSVRELGVDWEADPKFHSYDSGERVAIVSRRLLETIVETAKAHGYSVADLQQQVSVTVNNISNSVLGSTFSHSSVAVGANASASHTAAPVPVAARGATPPPAAVE